jgi:hypothetical protein
MKSILKNALFYGMDGACLFACKVQPLYAMVFKCLLAWVSWEYEEEQWGKGLISETAGQ